MQRGAQGAPLHLVPSSISSLTPLWSPMLPRHMHSKPYTAVSTAVVYAIPIRSSFIQGSTSLVIKAVTLSLNDQISDSIFSVSPSQTAAKTVSGHFVSHFTEFLKHAQTGGLEKTA